MANILTRRQIVRRDHRRVCVARLETSRIQEGRVVRCDHGIIDHCIAYPNGELHWIRLRRWSSPIRYHRAVKALAAEARFSAAIEARTGLVHQSPPGDAAVTPCCGKSPFELPATDRMTIDPISVTCNVRVPSTFWLEPELGIIEEDQ
jgi:hypothetical protein